MSESTRRKPLFRISIATLLFLMLCLGGYIAGYRNGFAHGNQKAVDSRLIVKTYPVGDLVANNPVAAADFDSLIDLIVATISPADWTANGTGAGEIQPYPSNRCLVVSQTQINHAKVAELLEDLHRKQARLAMTNETPTAP